MKSRLMFTTTPTTIFISLAALFLVVMALPTDVKADTQWMSLYDRGQTYRNNYDSSGSCWDQYNSYSNCYQGTWASTEYTYCFCSGSYAVNETPDRWSPTLGHNSPFYWEQKSTSSWSGAPGYARTNGSDYDSLRDHRVSSSRKTVHQNVGTGTYAYTYDQ